MARKFTQKDYRISGEKESPNHQPEGSSTMPKPYMIGIEIEEIALGTVLRRLNEMPGVVAIHMDLQKKSKAASDEGNKHHRATGRPRGRPPVSMAVMRDQLLAELVPAGREGVKVADLIKKFGPGRKGSIYAVMANLVRSEKVMRPAAGVYALVNGANVESPGPATVERSFEFFPPGVESPADLTPEMSKLLALFDKQATISPMDARRVLKTHKNAADWQMKNLVAKGLIRRTGKRGVYERVTTGGA